MTHKSIFTALVIVLLCISKVTYAQVASIQGKVTNEDHRPLENVSVIIPATKNGTVTSSDGNFYLTSVQPGFITVQFSSVGYHTVRKNFTLKTGQNLIKSVVLVSLQSELADVSINASRVNQQVRRASPSVSRMPISNLENPQSYSVLGAEAIKQQTITDHASALKAIPGLANISVGLAANNSVTLRGFSTASDYYRNGVFTYSFTTDPQGIERLEAIKGPSGTLFGSSSWISYGGLINRISKKPLDSLAGEVTLTRGTYGLTRLATDVNLPITPQKDVLFRLNAAYSSEQSFQDYGWRRSFFVAPSLKYRLDDRTSILFDFERYAFDGTVPTYITGFNTTAKSLRDIVKNYKKSFTDNDLSFERPTTINNVFLQADRKLSDRWNIDFSVGLSDFEYKQGNLYLNYISDNKLTRTFPNWRNRTNSANAQINLHGDLKWLNVRHRILLGTDYAYVTFRTGRRDNGILIDTVDYTRNATPKIDAGKIISAASILTNLQSTRNTFGLYAADVINPIEDLSIMLSLRYNYYDFKGNKVINTGAVTGGPVYEGSFTPKLGVTYQLLKKQLAVFANYMQGFNNVYAVLVNGATLKPEFAAQLEGGLKGDFLRGRIASTLSLYSIVVDNKIRPDLSNPALSVQDAQQTSKGIDADITANPVAGLTIAGGYGYNKSLYKKAAPALQGKTPRNAPKHSGNFWVNYTLPTGRLKGWGVGFGTTFSSAQFWNDANTYINPSFFLFNASVSYETRRLRIALKGDNLGNERYFDGTGLPQTLRRITGTVGVKF